MALGCVKGCAGREVATAISPVLPFNQRMLLAYTHCHYHHFSSAVVIAIGSYPKLLSPSPSFISILSGIMGKIMWILKCKITRRQFVLRKF